MTGAWVKTQGPLGNTKAPTPGNMVLTSGQDDELPRRFKNRLQVEQRVPPPVQAHVLEREGIRISSDFSAPGTQQREHRIQHLGKIQFGIGAIMVIEHHHDRIELRRITEHRAKTGNPACMPQIFSLERDA